MVCIDILTKQIKFEASDAKKQLLIMELNSIFAKNFEEDLTLLASFLFKKTLATGIDKSTSSVDLDTLLHNIK